MVEKMAKTSHKNAGKKVGHPHNAEQPEIRIKADVKKQ